VSDENVPQGSTPADDARGPLVAPELVPAIEQAAVRRPAPLWQSIAVALLVFALLASIGFGIVWAGGRWIDDRWGDAAQAMTAAEAFKAFFSGDADGFLALVEPGVRKEIKRADIQANQQVGATLQWAGPRFADGLASLKARNGPALGDIGTATFTPDPQRGDLVRMTASGGPFGEASGTIQLTRTAEGWRITGYRFAGFVEPTATPAAK
jgi:hypothetical protein